MIIDGKKFRSVTAAQMRGIDRSAIEDYKIPAVILMENAGRSIAGRAIAAYRQKGFRAPVLIVSGKGNNGGDGFVVARHLHNSGVKVRVMLLGKAADIRPESEPGVNAAILEKMNIPIEQIGDDPANFISALAESEMVIDALLGTGIGGEVREPFRSVIEQINAAGKYVIAVDTPSGLDCDEGRPLGCAVVADETVTLGLPKKGFENSEAAKYLGTLTLGEISLPRDLLIS